MQNRPILLIDSSNIELRLVENAYRETQFDYPIKIFNESKKAFEFIRGHAKEIFVILCDVHMPVMSGIEMLQTINANPALKLEAIPFIFLSNSKEKKDVMKAFELSAQGYFQKPYTEMEMTLFLRFIINYWSISERPH